MTPGVRQALAVADRFLGRAALRRLGRDDDAVVVLYHRVSPEPDPSYPPLAPQEFAAHLTLLQSAYRMVSLSELVGALADGQPLGGMCAVTFDDGYRDFLQHAVPVLEHQEVPVTHFLVIDCLRTGRPTWNLRLNRLRAGGLPPDITDNLPIGDLKMVLGAMPASEREAWLEAAEACVSVPPEPPMLSVEDLECFDSDLVTWASHTMTHASLGLLGGDEVSLELVGSKNGLEDLLGRAVPYVSYPNDSYTPEVERLALAAGYDAGFAVGNRPLAPGSRMLALPRFDLGGIPAGMVRLELAGVLGKMRRLRH